MKTENIATNLIQAFFIKLNKENIKYAVLRNYEGLPFENISKDIDIVVKPADYKVVLNHLQHVSKKLNYQLIWKNSLDYLCGFVFVKINDSKVYSIKFDVFNGFLWRGCFYLDSNYILKNTIQYNGFKVLNKAHEAFIMIIYYVLYAKKIKSKYLIPIEENISNNRKTFEDIVNFSFDSKLSKKIFEFIDRDRINDLVKLRPLLIREVISQNANFSVITRFLKHVKTEFYTRRKFGTLLVFSGPNSHEKSTLITVLLKLFYSLGITKDKIPYHFITTNNSQINELLVNTEDIINRDNSKSYKTKSGSIAKSVQRTVYFYIKFLIDRIVFIKRELKGNNIVVFDGYYTDIMVNPSRFGIGLKMNFIQKLYKTLPSPDYTFLALANKKLISNHENELKQEYSNLENNLSYCLMLLHDYNISDSLFISLKTVFDKLEKKYN